LTPVLVLTPVLLFVLTLAFLLRVAFKLQSRCSLEELSPDWLANFSIASYEPMHALLCDEDFAFLSQQPGFDLPLYRKLRKERLRIFRQYMNRLITDYNRLHAGARILLASTSYDQSDMMTRLIWLKLKFSKAVLHAEMNYLLCCVGFQTLTVRALIKRLEELSAQVALISAARAA
jgi:hypothetical protein